MICPLCSEETPTKIAFYLLERLPSDQASLAQHLINKHWSGKFNNNRCPCGEEINSWGQFVKHFKEQKNDHFLTWLLI